MYQRFISITIIRNKTLEDDDDDGNDDGVDQVAARTEESLGFDKPSFVFDHSEVRKLTKLLPQSSRFF